MRLRLLKGDISRVRANAIVTSANDALCGNDQPLYWRFTNQRNVDGAVRKIAGPGLRDACLALPEIKPVIHENEEPRDISRWAETAKNAACLELCGARRAAPSRRAPTAWTRTGVFMPWRPIPSSATKGTTKGILAYEARTCARGRRRRSRGSRRRM